MSAITEVVIDPEKEYERVAGELEEKEMAGAKHGGVSSRLLISLGLHVHSNHLGCVYGSTTSFRIGRNERMPDVSFLAASRIPPEGEPEGSWPISPDLAVEVVSPNDSYEKVIAKVNEYLAAGVREVWLISLQHRTIAIYRSPTDVTIIDEGGDLEGGDVVPGFRCRVSDLFSVPVSN